MAPADHRRWVARAGRYVDILSGVLGDGSLAGRFRLPDGRVAAFAILAMLTGVGSWYREGGRLGQRELIDVHTLMVMQCVGLQPHPLPEETLT